MTTNDPKTTDDTKTAMSDNELGTVVGGFGLSNKSPDQSKANIDVWAVFRWLFGSLKK